MNGPCGASISSRTTLILSHLLSLLGWHCYHRLSCTGCLCRQCCQVYIGSLTFAIIISWGLLLLIEVVGCLSLSDCAAHSCCLFCAVRLAVVFPDVECYRLNLSGQLIDPRLFTSFERSYRLLRCRRTECSFSAVAFCCGFKIAIDAIS